MTCSRGSLAHVVSGSCVATQDVASEPFRHLLTCVKEPRGIAGRGARTWRRLPTWCQGAVWRRRMWCQSVASPAHVASGNHVIPGCGVRLWRAGRAMWRCRARGVAKTPGDLLAPDWVLKERRGWTAGRASHHLASHLASQKMASERDVRC